MKKIVFILLFLSINSFSYSQSDSGLVGMWKSLVRASNKKTIPTFFVLNSDNSYVWGVDSATADTLSGYSTGIWNLTDDGEIKFVPSDTSREIRYYRPSGNNMYQYKYYEKDGKKAPVYMLEMDFYIERISYYSEK